MVRVWEAEKGAEFLSLKVKNSSPVVAFSSGSRLVAAATAEHTATVWELVTGQQLHTLSGHTRPIRSLAFTYDDQYLVTGDAGQTIKVWEVATGQEHASFLTPSGDLKNARLGTRPLLLALLDYRTLRFYDLLTGQETASLSESADITSFCFTSHRIVLGYKDSSIKVYDFTTGRELISLSGHTSSINALAFSTDRRVLATGSADQTIILQDSFPWQSRDLPGSETQGLSERMELFKRQYWKKRITHWSGS
jgi:WD40 repeat protein